MTSVLTGNGTCSETITHGPPAAGGRPQVKVTRTGNACGTIMSSGPTGVTETIPAPQPAMPAPIAPQRERLWTVGYPPHAVEIGAPPRT